MGRGIESRNGRRVLAVCVLLLLTSAIEVTATYTSIYPTKFSAENVAKGTPGGNRFDSELGEDWTVEMLEEVKEFIVGQLSLSPEKEIDNVLFTVEEISNAAEAADSYIRLSPSFLEEKSPGDSDGLKFEVQGLMYHEMTHIWQNNLGDYKNDPYFHGVIEGIATWMELVAGFGIDPQAYGGNWYDGYATTAYFLQWIEENIIPYFVNRLNQSMGLYQWSNDLFWDITSRDVEDLWEEYQASLYTYG